MTDERANRVLSRVRQVTAQVDDDICLTRAQGESPIRLSPGEALGGYRAGRVWDAGVVAAVFACGAGNRNRRTRRAGVLFANTRWHQRKAFSHV